MPGVSGYTYQYIFKRLEKDKIIAYPKMKIFYAAIYWKESLLSLEKEFGEIVLSAGEWSKEKNKFNPPYKVHIHWENWSKAKREFVCKDIEEGRLEAMAAYKEGKKEEKGWLFFIGSQNSQDPTIFHVDDHRLICCHVGEMIYPPKK